MIISNDINTVVQVLLGGATTTNAIQCTAQWADLPAAKFASGQTQTTVNSTTAVELVPAIQDNSRRVVNYISVFNSDTVAATITIRLYNGTTYTILMKVILNPNDHLIYNQ